MKSLWIFGYGSLVWRPAFPHIRSHPAFIRGYVRRFWQGSTDHRGWPGRPGRVVTLLAEGDTHGPSEEAHGNEPCWGTAYEIPAEGADLILAGLDHRERGGYERLEVEMTLVGETRVGTDDREGRPDALAVEAPAPGGSRSPVPGATVRGLVYVAGRENENYLGEASIEAIARQVAVSAGPSGPNPEYVFELARSLRAMGARDGHVFAVAEELARVLSLENGK